MNIDFNIDNYLRLSWQDILLAAISTLIIILVAKHFFWNKLLDFIHKRQQYIEDNLKESQSALDEAYALRNSYQKQINEIHVKADEILNKARIQADHESRLIVAKAQQEAEYTQQRAMEEIEKEQERVQREMKAAISDVAIAAATQLLQREINASDQQKMIDDFIDLQLGMDEEAAV